MTFVKKYNRHFHVYRKDLTEKARQYASGLMQAGSRKNMDRMAEVVPDAKSRNLQQFITHCNWSARDVIDDVAKDVNALLGDSVKAGLIIDESGFKKQGTMSVGVARQWLGRIGKVDNGQVAVFSVLANGRFSAPVDVRLYLPHKWTDDPKRCEKAGVPEKDRIFRTKEELALEMVENARANGLVFGWVGADAGYGKGPGFCMGLEDIGQQFVVDVHSDFHVFLDDTAPRIPEPRSKRGRKPTRYKAKGQSIEVSQVVSQFALSDQPVLKLRKTSRGPLLVRALRVPVYVWNGESNDVRQWHLIATQTLGKNPETKISLTNVPASKDLCTLAWMQLQRYWVERAFQDGKSECGMADYQVRKWKAWHHHMAMVMMALLFMLDERIRHKKTYPLLSCSDIEELLSRFLPRVMYRKRKSLANWSIAIENEW